MKMNSEVGNYLFTIIEDNKKPPAWLYQLSHLFLKYKVNIIPITFKHFLDVSRDFSKVSLLIVLTSLKSKNYFEASFYSLLGMQMRRDKIKLFHLSSFGEFYDFLMPKYQNNYHYYQLSIEIDTFTREVAAEIFKHKNVDQNWPGGRRARLPAI